LLLAAGELVYGAFTVTGQLDQLERTRHALVHFGFCFMTCAQTERNVLVDVEMRKERVVLKHHTEATAFGRQIRDVGALKLDRAGVGSLEPRDHAQGRRLAAARWTKQAEELAFSDGERHVGDGARRSKTTRNIL
jgi:hypothetical protein